MLSTTLASPRLSSTELFCDSNVPSLTPSRSHTLHTAQRTLKPGPLPPPALAACCASGPRRSQAHARRAPRMDDPQHQVHAQQPRWRSLSRRRYSTPALGRIPCTSPPSTSVPHRLHPTASLTPIRTRPQLDVSPLNIPRGDAQELGDGLCEIAGQAPNPTPVTTSYHLYLIHP
ncbi:hypothetical protein B0H13DRAFT_2563449 [Mycena leptocephala]|nr:hypothetical protein B0H13DRAFT_2563449 [Mycena leptocephala]